jgi:hypothetical protein
MTRLFITTDTEKATNIYNNTLDESNASIKSKLETDFAALPRQYDFKNICIIVLKDDFKNWQNHKIIEDKDFILYHSSSEQEVIDSIKKSFLGNHIQKGSHISDDYHDKIYRILFGDKNEKPNEILAILGFTQEQIDKKVILESKLNFLHDCLTPDGLKEAEVTNSDWAKLEDFTKLTAANDGPFGDNYLSALRTLRDKLLVS